MVEKALWYFASMASISNSGSEATEKKMKRIETAIASSFSSRKHQIFKMTDDENTENSQATRCTTKFSDLIL